MWCTEDGSRSLLGTVKTLLETGANDVMVVRPNEESIDNRERLIPWLEGDVILGVDLESRQISVRWHPDD